MSGATESARIAKLKVYSNSVRDSLGANLVSEWKLDEKNGTTPNFTTPDTWGSSIGTLYGSGGSQSFPQLQPTASCVSGSCYSFDGFDDYVDCGNADSLKNITNSITVSYWVYINAYPPTNYAWLVSKGQGSSSSNSWSASLTTTGSGYFFVRSGDNFAYSYADEAGWTSIPLKKWFYVTHVFNGASTYGATYQNGKIDKERSDMPFSSIYISNYSVRIGGGMSVDRYFNGLIDDVRIYNAAISTSKICENYLAGLSKLLANNGISKTEYDQRIAELNKNIAEK